MVRVYNARHSAIKKHEILLSAKTQMDLKIVRLSEVGQTEKEKCHMIFLIVESENKWYKIAYLKTERDSENELMVDGEEKG